MYHQAIDLWTETVQCFPVATRESLHEPLTLV